MKNLAYCLLAALGLTALALADENIESRTVEGSISTDTMILTNRNTRPEVLESVTWRYFNGGGITGTVSVEIVRGSVTSLLHRAALAAKTNHIFYPEGTVWILKDQTVRIFDNSVITGDVIVAIGKGGK